MASLPSLVLVLVLLVSVADTRLLEFRVETVILVKEDIVELQVGMVVLLAVVRFASLVMVVCRTVWT